VHCLTGLRKPHIPDKWMREAKPPRAEILRRKRLGGSDSAKIVERILADAVVESEGMVERVRQASPSSM
jgi:hypothetical protein